MVKDLAVVRAFAHLAAAVATRLHRMAFLQPVNHVEVVNVLVDNVIAAEPHEVVQVAKMIFHFSELASVLLLEVRALVAPRSVAVPISTHRVDVPDLAVPQTFHRFEITKLMMALKPDADFQIFLLRFLRCGHEATEASGINANWLLRENIFSLTDRFLEHHRPKSRWCGENHNVSERYGFLVTVEPDELVLLRYIDLFLMLAFQSIERAREAIFVDVGDSDEFHAFARAECLGRCSRAAPAAADERNLQRIARRRRVSEAVDGQSTERRGARDGFGSVRKKTATSDCLRDYFVHGVWFCSDAPVATEFNVQERSGVGRAWRFRSGLSSAAWTVLDARR